MAFPHIIAVIAANKLDEIELVAENDPRSSPAVSLPQPLLIGIDAWPRKNLDPTDSNACSAKAAWALSTQAWMNARELGRR